MSYSTFSKKALVNLVKILRDLTSISEAHRTEKQRQRIAITHQQLEAIDAKSPGIVRHFKRDMRQANNIRGKRNRHKAEILVSRLRANGRRPSLDDSVFVESGVIRRLNRNGFGIGDNTIAALVEHRLVTKIKGGHLVVRPPKKPKEKEKRQQPSNPQPQGSPTRSTTSFNGGTNHVS